MDAPLYLLGAKGDFGMSCIFCQIVGGEIPSDIVYQDDEFIAFKDIHPQTPVHLLIIPKKHIVSIADLEDEDAPLMGRMITFAKKIGQMVSEKGYRLVINTGLDGGQVVMHIHMHLLGGRKIPDRMR